MKAKSKQDLIYKQPSLFGSALFEDRDSHGTQELEETQSLFDSEDFGDYNKSTVSMVKKKLNNIEVIGFVLNSKPMMSSYFVSDRDIDDFDLYQDLLKKREEKIEKWGDILAKPLWFAVIVALVVFYVVFSNLVNKNIVELPQSASDMLSWISPEVVNDLINIVIRLAISAFYGFLAFFISVFIFVFFIPLVDWIAKGLAKMFLKYPQKPAKYDNVQEYRNAVLKYEEERSALCRTFPGITDFGFNIKQYAQQVLEKFIDSIAQYYAECYKRNTKDWWVNLSPYEFEKEVAKWYYAQGYVAETTKQSGDGGIDIILKKDDEIAYVQCKRFTTSKVSVEVVRELYGVMVADNVEHGFIVCIKGVTAEAKAFMNRCGIELVTLDDLVENDDGDLDCDSMGFFYDSWLSLGRFYLYAKVYTDKTLAEKKIVEIDPHKEECNLFYRDGLYIILQGDKEELGDLNDFFHPKPVYKKYVKRKYYRRRRYYNYRRY